jgi:hypothetical protein
MKQRQELEQAVKELHDHIEQAERKDSEKQSLLVAGLEEGVRGRRVEERRGQAAREEEEMADRE